MHDDHEDDHHNSMEDHQPLIMLLREGFRWCIERLNERAVAEGGPRISASAAIVMSYLQPDGVRPAEIARRMGVTRQHVHTVVRELVTAGLLVVSPDPQSRRDKLIKPTGAGEQRRQHALQHVTDLENEVRDRLGPDEFAQLRTLLIRAWAPPKTSRRPGDDTKGSRRQRGPDSRGDR